MSCGTTLSQPAPGAIAFNPPSPGSTFIKTWRTFALWMERRQQRRALSDLAELNGHLLSDIGVTRTEALLESQKPFWR